MIRCDGCFIEQWQPADVIYVSKGAIDFAVVKIAIVPLGRKQFNLHVTEFYVANQYWSCVI